MSGEVAPSISRRMPLVLLTAFLLHNLEEAVTYPTYREQSQELVSRLISTSFEAPSVASFHFTLIAISLAAALMMSWVLLHREGATSNLLLDTLAWVMIANVVVPHVPAAVLAGGYTPGLISALLLNLPVAGWVVTRRR